MMKHVRSYAALMLATMALAWGCGESGRNGGGDGSGEPSLALQSIEVLPGENTLVIEGDTPATAEYMAIGTFEDGSTADITDQVQFRLGDTRLGSFEGYRLTTGTAHGGRTRVRASVAGGNVIGTADVVIRVQQRYQDPSTPDVPADPGARFDGEEGDRAPVLVYPSDGVLVPPNLRKLELHFYPGEGNTLFELAFQSDTTDVKVYTRCAVPMNGGCIYTPDVRVWRWMAESNRAGAVQVSVRGTDDAGSAVSASAPILVRFSQDDIQGAIYYWTTSDTSDSSTAIMRYDFGATDRTAAERFIGTERTGGACVGCHALSRSGNKLLTATGGSYDARVLLLDVGSRMPLFEFGKLSRSAFSAWNPDGSQYVGVFADERDEGFISYDLNIFDGVSGDLLSTIDVGGSEEHPTTHPDWSPDGQHIAYTHVGYVKSLRRDNGTLALADQSSLRMVSRDGDGWTEPVLLTESIEGQSTYYPTFSPGGDILVFNRSVCADGNNGDDCDAYDDPGATLYAMLPEPGAAPVALAAANAPGPTDERTTVENSYPKWSPFTFQRTGEFGTRLHWITFSSDRNFGLREPPASHTLIWMAGVDPDMAHGDQDPSYPAFALPFQDLDTDNHTAQWAERAIGIIP